MEIEDEQHTHAPRSKSTKPTRTTPPQEKPNPQEPRKPPKIQIKTWRSQAADPHPKTQDSQCGRIDQAANGNHLVRGMNATLTQENLATKTETETAEVERGRRAGGFRESRE